MPQVAVAKQISPVVIDADPPSNPDLRKIADDAIARLKLSFAMAASGDHDATPDEDQQAFRAFLATRKPKARAAYQQKARELLQAPADVRSAHFGRYSAAELKSDTTVADIVKKVGTLQVDGASVKTGLEEHGKKSGKHTTSHKSDQDNQADQKAGEAFQKMRLNITRIKCIRDTDDQWGGDDIALGGLFVSALGKTTKVKAFEPTEDDFESGDVTKPGMKRNFALWDIETKPNGFPYVYTAILSLAETDDGGFADFIENLWEHVKKVVIGAVSVAAGAAFGAAIGAAFAGIGVLVGLALGGFIGWLIDIFHNNDDIIGAKTVRITLGESTKSYYDSRDLTAPGGHTRTLDYKGQGGHYLIDVMFRVAVN